MDLFKTKFSGVIEDSRNTHEKSLDYKFEETVASSEVVNWIEKSPAEWKVYPIQNQDGSGSCVAQTVAKMAGIHHNLNHGEFIPYSATFIYNKRSNKPASGMWGVDAFNIWRNKGIVPEVMMESQSMNDSQMAQIPEDSADKLVGEVFTIGNYVLLPIKDAETVASVIQRTGKPVMVWFRSDYSAWSRDYPIAPSPSSNLEVHHSVTAIDFCLINGEKHIIIEDSWGSTGILGRGQRAVSVDVFNKTNTFAAYTLNFKYDDREEKPDQRKPKFNLNADLLYGMTGNADVVNLQKMLKYEGLFPANVSATGNYFGLTANAVVKYQKKYNIAEDWYIDAYLTGDKSRVGPKTRAHINKNYRT